MNQEVINQSEWKKPENWAGPVWAPMYFSKSDSRIIVPKHLRRGWTLNLGQNKSVAWLVVVLLTISLTALAASALAFRIAYGSPFRGFSSASTASPVSLSFLSDIAALSDINSSISESEFRDILSRQPIKASLRWNASDSSITYSIADASGHRASLTFQNGTCVSIRRLPDISGE
jgi:hypothetical protein